jgi:hypothetical protein
MLVDLFLLVQQRFINSLGYSRVASIANKIYK